MDLLSVAESWLDVLAAIIGVVSTIVGVYTAIRLVEWQEPTLSQQSSTAVYRKASAPMSAPLAASAAAAAASSSALRRPDVRPHGAKESAAPAAVAAAPTPDSPWLALKQLRKVSDDCLRLTLRNDGDTLIFAVLQPGTHHEMEAIYDPPVFREKESYARGSALNIALQHPVIEQATYQFWVHYRDLAGQSYRQEIVGMGTDRPIVEPPQPLS